MSILYWRVRSKMCAILRPHLRQIYAFVIINMYISTVWIESASSRPPKVALVSINRTSHFRNSNVLLDTEMNTFVCSSNKYIAYTTCVMDRPPNSLLVWPSKTNSIALNWWVLCVFHMQLHLGTVLPPYNADYEVQKKLTALHAGHEFTDKGEVIKERWKEKWEIEYWKRPVKCCYIVILMSWHPVNDLKAFKKALERSCLIDKVSLQESSLYKLYIQ